MIPDPCETCRGDHPSQDHYREAFTNPVTRKPYPTPKALQSAATRICRSYSIRGIADPQYIANVIATELAIGDGQSHFAPFDVGGPFEQDVDLDPHGDVASVFDMPDPTVDDLRMLAARAMDDTDDGVWMHDALHAIADRIEATIRREANVPIPTPPEWVGTAWPPGNGDPGAIR